MKEVAKKLAEKIPGVGIVTKVAGCLNQILGAFFNAFEAASKGAADRLRAKHTGSVEDAQMDAIDQAMAKGGHTLYAALAAQKVVEKLAEPPCNPAPSHYDTSQYPVSASWDPNDKRTGGAYPCEPAGEGAEQACGRHFVPLAQATEPIDYVILFENKAAATEPAEDVTITDLLDADLDPQTLQVLGSSHPAALQPPAVDGQEVVFRFEDVALPPNVAKPQGEGFVAFRVRPRAGLAAGAEIRNKASIVFDFNPAIETPEVVHVLGLADLDVAPASHDFGEVAIASPSGPVGFTLKNLGGQPLALASIVLEGAGAGAFHLSDGGCAGRTLALGETCNATVRFVPDAAGERTAALRVRSSDAATPTLDVPLAGIGLGPEIEVTPGEAALPALASPGDAGVPVLQVRLRAGAAEAVRVESLALRAGGDADDARDVTRVRVVRDDDGDGAADAGEAVLWAGAWPADDGTVVAMLSPALEVPAGASATLLVVYDLAGPAGAAAMPGALLAIVLVLPAVRRRGRRVVPAIVAAVATAAACGGGNGGGGDDVPGPKRHALTVTRSGAGSGTVTGTPAGIACGTACSATYDEGTAVTLTATADVSSVFAGFGGACAGTGACTVTMDGPREVTAAFAAARRHRVSVTGVTAAGAVSGVGAEATGLPVTGSDLVVPR
jgi:hypothetical protein